MSENFYFLSHFYIFSVTFQMLSKYFKMCNTFIVSICRITGDVCESFTCKPSAFICSRVGRSSQNAAPLPTSVQPVHTSLSSSFRPSMSCGRLRFYQVDRLVGDFTSCCPGLYIFIHLLIYCSLVHFYVLIQDTYTVKKTLF